MEHPISRRRLAVCWLLTLGAFAAGVVALEPYLAREHRRLTSIQVALLWTSEAVSGFWFLRFGARHLLAGRPMPPQAGGREYAVVVASLLAGWLLDIGLTGYKFWEEAAARKRSIGAPGLVTGGGLGPPPSPGGTRFAHLRGEYTDGSGTRHEFDAVRDWQTLPAAVLTAVRSGRLPAAIPVQYDPEQPERIWLPGETPVERVYALSGMIQAAQVGLLIGPLANGPARVRLLRRIPVEQVGPFGVTAVVLFAVGLWRWLTGQDAL